MMTYSCLTKDYDHLAKCLVPMGAQVGMTHQERMDMLRSKTRKFTPEEIQQKFAKGSAAAQATKESKTASASKPAVSRRASITLAASKAKASIGESSGMAVNPDLLSQRM